MEDGGGYPKTGRLSDDVADSPLAKTIPAGVVLLWYEGYKILENP